MTLHYSTADEDASNRQSFDSLSLSPEVLRALREMGYANPTPVQVASFEPIAKNRDVIVQARTGTGKTTAFALPLIEQVGKRERGAGVQVLCLCPTRELAMQVATEVSRLGKYKQIRVAVVYGGAPMGKQIAELEQGAQIVVGTPGRVLDHVRRHTLNTSNIRSLVLDEADEMLSMGFDKELSAIMAELPKNRQMLLFSATLTQDVQRLSREMREPEQVLLSGDQVGALELTHYFFMQQGDKVRDLLRILEVENPQSAILFCNTKDETERVARELKKAGFAADYLSGDLEQKERERVLQATREERLRFLVATDVAARGIDISHLTHVINVDFPDTPEQYVHRTGRTGRAGRMGTAISLIAPKDVGNLYYLRLTYQLKPIERTLPTAEELQTRREQDLLHSVIQAWNARKGASDVELLGTARRLLTHDDADHLVTVLLRSYIGSAVLAAEAAAKERRQATPPTTDSPSVKERPKAPEKLPERPVERAKEREPSAEARPTKEVKERDVRSSKERQENKIRGDGPSASPAVESPLRAPRSSQPSSLRTEAEKSEREATSTPTMRSPEVPQPVKEVKPPVELAPTPVSEPVVEPKAEARIERRAPGELANWAPKAESDDDQPILVKEIAALNVELDRSRESGDSSDDDSPIATLYFNAGRRDGWKPYELVRLLGEKASITPDSVGRIRMRDRNTFLEIRKELVEKVILALKGHVVGDRVLNVETARSRDPNEADG